jgi:hypothetical protein
MLIIGGMPRSRMRWPMPKDMPGGKPEPSPVDPVPPNHYDLTFVGRILNFYRGEPGDGRIDSPFLGGNASLKMSLPELTHH